VSALSPPVVIVGAGVSGLCCALHLQQRGVRGLLLEADGAVGGRVQTDRVDGFLLDRELRASSRALEFLFRTFAEGDAALPAHGMGAIASQLAARLAPGTLRTRTRVARLDRSGVTLESGDRIDARSVVVATTARAAAKLVPGLAVPESNPACCLQFDAPGSPPVGDFLVLDASGEGPVNELCVPSQVVPSYAPPGRALVSASVLAPIPADDELLEADVRRQLTTWFGPEVSSWKLLRINRIPDALPFQPPGPFEPGRRSTQLSDRLFICGDHRDLASLQGAMASGRRAAMAVAEALG
jgi:phytoene dehydrogenase-like protein